jgi:hypothetical protein
MAGLHISTGGSLLEEAESTAFYLVIEVLKNLENLAAADPGLYRTIVDQIKGKYINDRLLYVKFQYTFIKLQDTNILIQFFLLYFWKSLNYCVDICYELLGHKI